MADGYEDLLWRSETEKHIVDNEYIDFRETYYRMPDNEVSGPYYSYSRRDYCVVVARDAGGKYLCVHQYRQGIRKVTTEFPAGGIERSDGKQYGEDADRGESALEAAKRELQEETGYASDDWKFLMKVPSNATIADNYAYLYCADGCRKVSGQHLDSTEYLRVQLLSEEELRRQIRQGGFEQAIHILAYLAAQEQETGNRGD